MFDTFVDEQRGKKKETDASIYHMTQVIIFIKMSLFKGQAPILVFLYFD